MLFAIKVASRYFMRGGGQTVLTMAGVAFGVTVYIFITTLIAGLQSGLIARTIGSISQVTVKPVESQARTLPLPGETNLAEAQPFTEREPRIRSWQGLIPVLDTFPGVTAVSPVATTAGFATVGGQSRPITLIGVQEDRHVQIIDLRQNMREGVLNLSGQGVAVGIELARLLGLRPRDKIRVVSARGIEQVLTVTGIFDGGNVNINERSVYVSLSNGQRLADLVGDVSRIEMKVEKPFEADLVAQRIAAATGFEMANWKEDNRELLGALQSQSGTTDIIRFFVMVLVATGVASVLIVSVLQRSREIGILRSMGASTGKMLTVFVTLGFFIGAGGALMGAGIGGGLVLLLAQLPGNNPIRPGFLFPILFELRYPVEAVVTATIVGTLSAFFPARRAAKMNPVDVIRYG